MASQENESEVTEWGLHFPNVGVTTQYRSEAVARGEMTPESVLVRRTRTTLVTDWEPALPPGR